MKTLDRADALGLYEERQAPVGVDDGDRCEGGNPPGPVLTTARPEMLTCLVAECGAVDGALVRNVIYGAGGVDAPPAVSVGGGPMTTAFFWSVSGATRAAAGLARAAAAIAATDATQGAGIRMALCTAVADDDASPLGARSVARAGELLRRAMPDQILATASTAAMAGQTLSSGAEILDRGNCRLAPDGALERIYELRVDRAKDMAGGRSVPSNLDWARRALHGPLLGADPELAALEAAWKEARNGHCRLAVVSGDGRRTTAFVAELALRLHFDGALVLYGRCDGGPAVPYQAIREALGVYADGCSTDKLRADLEGWGDEIARILPDVGARVGRRVHPGGSAGHGSAVRLFQAVELWLRAVVTRSPTLLVLDDLHLADPSSLLMLEHLWHARSTLPLMVVAAVSPEGAAAPGALDWLDGSGEHVEAGDASVIRLDVCPDAAPPTRRALRTPA